jgi:hypothetical protein
MWNYCWNNYCVIFIRLADKKVKFTAETDFYSALLVANGKSEWRQVFDAIIISTIIPPVYYLLIFNKLKFLVFPCSGVMVFRVPGFTNSPPQRLLRHSFRKNFVIVLEGKKVEVAFIFFYLLAQLRDTDVVTNNVDKKQIIYNYWTKLSKISWFVSGEQINYLRQIIDHPTSKVLSYFFSARHGEAREILQNLCIFFVEPTIQKRG